MKKHCLLYPSYIYDMSQKGKNQLHRNFFHSRQKIHDRLFTHSCFFYLNSDYMRKINGRVAAEKNVSLHL